MTNEELAAAIQAGESNLLPELWEQVERFISQQAGKRARALNGYGGVTEEDLYQCGYFALLAAVKTFTPEKGKFVGWLAFALKSAFAEATGHRGKKYNLLDVATSLDIPLDNEDGGSAALSDLQADARAQQDFEDTEHKIWLEQLHIAMEDALSQLPEGGQEIIKARYYEKCTLADTAASVGVSIEAIRGRIHKALFQLRKNKCLRRFIEYHTSYYLHVGVTSFKSTSISSTERVVLERERIEEQWLANHFHNLLPAIDGENTA